MKAVSIVLNLNYEYILLCFVVLAIICIVYLWFTLTKLKKKVKRIDTKNKRLKINYKLANQQFLKLQSHLTVIIKEEKNETVKVVLKALKHYLKERKGEDPFFTDTSQKKGLDKINKLAPFLNEKEQLICFYLSQELPHKKIAELLNKTEKSIDSYKYRISLKVKNHHKISVKEFFNSLKIN